VFEIISWIVTGFSILGTVLNIYKNKWCFIIWIITNFAWIIINLVLGMYPQVVLFSVYLATSIWGMIAWFKGEKCQKDKATASTTKG
jgi:hypothetical protein